MDHEIRDGVGLIGIRPKRRHAFGGDMARASIENRNTAFDIRVEAFVLTNRERRPSGCGRGDHRLDIAGPERQGFLDKAVHARLQERHGDVAMGFRRRRDDREVNRRGEIPRRMGEIKPQGSRKGFPRCVDIHDPGDQNRRHGEERAQVQPPHFAQTDHKRPFARLAVAGYCFRNH
ncbi:hypothetical protein [Breoghania sp. L-A4]|uniref:hypothetical protein n=1 Tax=Breoghania sp. L-A4 TaxID=2304600 RepID=UPI0020BD4EF9|nr:hypothetical protein [Breoghania sp. L-A4]